MAKPKLTDRIATYLAAHGPTKFYDLALALYPDNKSHRYSSNGGPPGCMMALSRGVKRGGFHVEYPKTARTVAAGIVWPKRYQPKDSSHG